MLLLLLCGVMLNDFQIGALLESKESKGSSDLYGTYSTKVTINPDNQHTVNKITTIHAQCLITHACLVHKVKPKEKYARTQIQECTCSCLAHEKSHRVLRDI